MFETIGIPVIALGTLGATFALLLVISSKVFYVEQDERLPLIIEALPGANCGGCGYPGCGGLAGAIIEGKAATNACPVGGNQVAAKIAEIMGQEAIVSEPLVAHVNCRGGINAKKKYEYMGIEDCAAAAKLQGGPIECGYGCLGLGNCVRACGYGGVKIVNGVAVIMADKCRACGRCVAACPRKLITVESYDQDVFVSCSNHNKGGELRSICNIGCIGCSLCVKACEHDAIKVENFLAKIDYEKCTNCGKCALACPRKLIDNLSEITTQTYDK